MEQLQTTNALMKEDLAISKNQILSLEEENRVLRDHQDSIVEDHQRKLQVWCFFCLAREGEGVLQATSVCQISGTRKACKVVGSTINVFLVAA